MKCQKCDKNFKDKFIHRHHIIPIEIGGSDEDGTIYIKVDEPDHPWRNVGNKYKLKHVHIWEQAYGIVPRHDVVLFFDGNRMNCVLENLTLVTRAEFTILTKLGYNQYEDELKPSILALAKLRAMISLKQKETLGG